MWIINFPLIDWNTVLIQIPGSELLQVIYTIMKPDDVDVQSCAGKLPQVSNIKQVSPSSTDCVHHTIISCICRFYEFYI